jgi:hypothetical protein
MREIELDATFGVSDASVCIFYALKRLLVGGIYKHDHIYIQTFIFYNGGEKSIGLIISDFREPSEERIIVFGENRNSDSLFVDSWTRSMSSINPPTVTEFPDEVYEERVFCSHNGYSLIAEHIYTTYLKNLCLGEEQREKDTGR